MLLVELLITALASHQAGGSIMDGLEPGVLFTGLAIMWLGQSCSTSTGCPGKRGSCIGIPGLHNCFGRQGRRSLTWYPWLVGGNSQLAMEKTARSYIPADPGDHREPGNGHFAWQRRTVIAHHGTDLVFAKFHLHLHAHGRMGVLADVSQGFLDDAKDCNSRSGASLRCSPVTMHWQWIAGICCCRSLQSVWSAAGKSQIFQYGRP